MIPLKYRLRHPIDVLSGSDGYPAGWVYMMTNSIPVIRKHVIPANPDTSEQSAIRTILTTAAQGFKTLTDAERAAWVTFAAMQPRSTLGYQFTMQEMAAYVQVNSFRQIDAQAISNTAPSAMAAFSASAIGTVAYVVATTVFSFIVTHNCAAPAGEQWLIRITDTLQSAQYHARPSDFRLADGVAATSIVAVSASPQTIQITDPVFDWANNDYMQIEVVPLSAAYAPGTTFGWRGQISVT